jgi:hypothetical protein
MAVAVVTVLAALFFANDVLFAGLLLDDYKKTTGTILFDIAGVAVIKTALIHAAGALIEEGPLGRQGGRNIDGTSVYASDPDSNLVELMVYPA